MILNTYGSLHSLLITCDYTTSKHMFFNGLEISFFAKCNLFDQELYLDNLLHTIFISEKQFHTCYVCYVGIQYVHRLDDAEIIFSERA